MTTTIRDPVSPDLRKTLRALKLGQMLATLPERLTLARQQKMAHADFLELVLADEVDPPRGQVRFAAGPRRRAGCQHAARHLGRVRRHRLRPAALERAGQLAVPRRPARRPDPRAGRCRQDTPGVSAGAHRDPPPPHRPHGHAPASCSNGSRRPVSTTPWTTRCAASPESSS